MDKIYVKVLKGKELAARVAEVLAAEGIEMVQTTDEDLDILQFEGRVLDGTVKPVFTEDFEFPEIDEQYKLLFRITEQVRYNGISFDLYPLTVNGDLIEDFASAFNSTVLSDNWTDYAHGRMAEGLSTNEILILALFGRNPPQSVLDRFINGHILFNDMPLNTSIFTKEWFENAFNNFDAVRGTLHLECDVCEGLDS